jgi:hypothetical protein
LALGNSFLELGVDIAIALPEVNGLEYSYQNLDHLVDKTFDMRDGYFYASNEAGHGLTLSEEARSLWRRACALSDTETGAGGY